MDDIKIEKHNNRNKNLNHVLKLNAIVKEPIFKLFQDWKNIQGGEKN